MQPPGHIAGVGAAVVASLSTLVSVPLGALVAYIFDGTLYALITAYVVFGVGALAAMKWADGGWMPRRRRAPLKASADL